VEKDVRDSFERIEKRLNAIEDLGKELKAAIDEISTDLLAADEEKGVSAKLDKVLRLLESKK
jgi:prefoldin subunit 5